MFRSLHQRTSQRAGSRSQQDGDQLVESPPGTSHLEDERREQRKRDSAVIQTGHQTLAQSENENREVSDDNKSITSVRSEQTFLQRRDLGMLDVAALIINKQIGTGIFTTPGLVLNLTGSKTVSIVMWFCGGIWAFLR
jgi:amino acid permease